MSEATQGRGVVDGSIINQGDRLHGAGLIEVLSSIAPSARRGVIP